MKKKEQARARIIPPIFEPQHWFLYVVAPVGDISTVIFHSYKEVPNIKQYEKMKKIVSVAAS
jgi:hypothetical protein